MKKRTKNKKDVNTILDKLEELYPSLPLEV